MPRIQYKSYMGITLLARNLRKNCTPAEVSLWNILRRKNILGYKFLRQHPIFYRIDNDWVEFYITDFYCAKLRLNIELDGPIHLYKVEYDSERDAKLRNKDIHVLRIKNEELDNINKIINDIQEIIKLLESQGSNI